MLGGEATDTAASLAGHESRRPIVIGNEIKSNCNYLSPGSGDAQADPGFTAANISHLVYATISPILEKFILTTGRKILPGDEAVFAEYKCFLALRVFPCLHFSLMDRQ